MSETLQVAVHSFVEQGNAEADFRDYLRREAEKAGIRVNAVDTSELVKHVVRLNIATVNQSFDAFLDNLRHERPDSSEWGAKNSDETQLAFTKRALKITSCSINDFDLRLYDFYRLIRNRFCHPAKAHEYASRIKLCQKPLITMIKQSRYKKLSAPNSYEELTFDDFVLFSRVCKYLVQDICIGGKPSPDLLLKMLEQVDKQSPELFSWSELRKLQESPDNQARFLREKLRRLYSCNDLQLATAVMCAYNGKGC